MSVLFCGSKTCFAPSVFLCAALVLFPSFAWAQSRTDSPVPADQDSRVAIELSLLRAEVARHADRDTSSRADWWMVGITGTASFAALITLVVLWQQTKAAALSARAAENSAAAAMLAERAYVDVSHTPEGLVIAGPSDAGHWMSVRFHVKNHGRTPADVFSIKLGVWFGPTELPEVPPYENSREISGGMFLMPGEKVSLAINGFKALSSPDYQAIRDGTRSLVLMVCVDYSDRFGRKHRNGYARRFDRTAAAGQNNLVFVTQRGYNFDRELIDPPERA